MSGTSYSMTVPGETGVGRALDREDRLHALDEHVRIAFVEAARPLEVAHDAHGLHERFRVVEDRFVVEA